MLTTSTTASSGCPGCTTCPTSTVLRVTRPATGAVIVAYSRLSSASLNVARASSTWAWAAEALPPRADACRRGLEQALRVIELLSCDQLALEQLADPPAIESSPLVLRLARRDGGLRRLRGRAGGAG